MARTPDDDVGSSGPPAAGGGHQTPQQAAITQQSGGGVSDAERNAGWREAGGQPGRPPTVPPGGASGGHGEHKKADDLPGEKSASFETRTSRTGGKLDG